MYEQLQRLEIQRISTAEQAADMLRDNILDGVLKPGMPLREHSLAATLGISRNTLREALRLLARENLVTYQMHRGVVVAEISESDVSDIYAARRLIELAAVNAGKTADADVLQGVAAIAEEFAAEAAKRHSPQISALDRKFHRELVSLLRNTRLEELFERLQGELTLAFAIIDRAYVEEALLYADEHREIARLLVARKTRECRAALTDHLTHAELRLQELARDGGTGKSTAPRRSTAADRSSPKPRKVL